MFIHFYVHHPCNFHFFSTKNIQSEIHWLRKLWFIVISYLLQLKLEIGDFFFNPEKKDHHNCLTLNSYCWFINMSWLCKLELNV